MTQLQSQHFYLVGIKGVAMTSLAQILLDAGKTLRGSDVAESFVTQPLLDSLKIQIDDFSAPIPSDIDVVIYTAAHQGKNHPQVQAAMAQGKPVASQAEALSWFFNQKKGIAVCGVGGKSTVSAMLTWILEKKGMSPSFSVGVGKIVGMDKTGAWREKSEFFITEADEYATNPAYASQGEELIPRFSFLNPFISICTHFKFDHPDVYTDQAHAQSVFGTFLAQTHSSGAIILNEVDVQRWPNLTQKVLTFGTSDQATLQYQHTPEESLEGKTVGTITMGGHSLPISLQVPGAYNLENAAAAILAAYQLGIPISESAQILSSFQSTARRFERKGEFNSAILYDDYAHHPSELEAVISALHEWYPSRRTVVAFQPHTYSRTKSLLLEFAQVLSNTKELILLDIFASARENPDPSISSQQLADLIKKYSPQLPITVLPNYQSLADHLSANLEPGNVCLTIGAGDIYKASDILLSQPV